MPYSISIKRQRRKYDEKKLFNYLLVTCCFGSLLSGSNIIAQESETLENPTFEEIEIGQVIYNSNAIDKSKYDQVLEGLFVNKALLDFEVDFTKIPRFGIAKVDGEHYIANVENYFNSVNGDIIYEDKLPNNSFVLVKDLGDGKGRFQVNAEYANQYQSFGASVISYSLSEDLDTNSLNQNLIYFGYMYEGIVNLTEDELTFSSKDDAIKKVEDFVNDVYHYPNIDVIEMKSLTADQLQAYVDYENLNKIKENQADWLVEPKDLYLIEFQVGFSDIMITDKTAYEGEYRPIIPGMKGSAMVSKDGLEFIFLNNILETENELPPFESTLAKEALYETIYAAMERRVSVGRNLPGMEYFVKNLEVAYVPYFVGGPEMAYSPIWIVTVEYPLTSINKHGEAQDYINEVEIFIDPVTGNELNGKGA